MSWGPVAARRLRKSRQPALEMDKFLIRHDRFQRRIQQRFVAPPTDLDAALERYGMSRRPACNARQALNAALAEIFASGLEAAHRGAAPSRPCAPILLQLAMRGAALANGAIAFKACRPRDDLDLMRSESCIRGRITPTPCRRPRSP